MAPRKLSKQASSLLTAIIDATSASDLNAAQSGLQEFLEPLLSFEAGQACRDERESLAAFSSRYGPLLIEILKHSNAKLSRPLDSENARGYYSITSVALDGLHAIRSSLQGRPFEVEVQRYALLRKLFALGFFEEAMKQAEIIISSMRTVWGLQPANSATATQRSCMLPHPGELQDQEPVALAVRVAVYLALCRFARGQPGGSWVDLKSFMRDLAPWLRYVHMS